MDNKLVIKKKLKKKKLLKKNWTFKRDYKLLKKLWTFKRDYIYMLNARPTRIFFPVSVYFNEIVTGFFFIFCQFEKILFFFKKKFYFRILVLEVLTLYLRKTYKMYDSVRISHNKRPMKKQTSHKIATFFSI